jgi:hypothetical protein
LFPARSQKFHKAPALLAFIYGNPRLMPRDLKVCRISRSSSRIFRPGRMRSHKSLCLLTWRFRTANLTNVS